MARKDALLRLHARLVARRDALRKALNGDQDSFRELAALLQRDPELKKRWLSVRERGFEGFAQLFNLFVAAGVLRAPTDPTEIRRLTELIWLISEFWLPTLEISDRTTRSDDFYHGVELMSQVMAPYVVTSPARRPNSPGKTRA